MSNQKPQPKTQLKGSDTKKVAGGRTGLPTQDVTSVDEKIEDKSTGTPTMPVGKEF